MNAKTFQNVEETTLFSNLDGVMATFMIGRNKAAELAKQANAVYRIGHAYRYDLQAIADWLRAGGQFVSNHAQKYDSEKNRQALTKLNERTAANKKTKKGE